MPREELEALHAEARRLVDAIIRAHLDGLRPDAYLAGDASAPLIYLVDQQLEACQYQRDAYQLPEPFNGRVLDLPREHHPRVIFIVINPNVDPDEDCPTYQTPVTEWLQYYHDRLQTHRNRRGKIVKRVGGREKAIATYNRMEKILRQVLGQDAILGIDAIVVDMVPYKAVSPGTAQQIAAAAAVCQPILLSLLAAVRPEAIVALSHDTADHVAQLFGTVAPAGRLAGQSMQPDEQVVEALQLRPTTVVCGPHPSRMTLPAEALVVRELGRALGIDMAADAVDGETPAVRDAPAKLNRADLAPFFEALKERLAQAGIEAQIDLPNRLLRVRSGSKEINTVWRPVGLDVELYRGGLDGPAEKRRFLAAITDQVEELIGKFAAADEGDVRVDTWGRKRGRPMKALRVFVRRERARPDDPLEAARQNLDWAEKAMKLFLDQFGP